MLQKIIGFFLNIFSSLSKTDTTPDTQPTPKAKEKAKEKWEVLQDLYAKHGGTWNAEINIFGVRNKENPLSNRFDDRIGVAYKNPATKEWEYKLYDGTTDPGVSQGLTFAHAGYRSIVHLSPLWNWFATLDQVQSGA